MNYDPIEAKLKSALQKATPDILDDILEGCDREKGQVISMEKRKNKKDGKHCVSRPFLISLLLIT